MAQLFNFNISLLNEDLYSEVSLEEFLDFINRLKIVLDNTSAINDIIKKTIT